MFHWEPEGRYHCTKSMATAPFWFSTEHRWSALAPFWLSADNIKPFTNYKGSFLSISNTFCIPWIYLLVLHKIFIISVYHGIYSNWECCHSHLLLIHGRLEILVMTVVSFDFWILSNFRWSSVWRYIVGLSHI